MGTYTGQDKRLQFLFDMVSNFASIYSNTGTYAVGAYAIYQGVLYKCTTAVTVAEDFDPTKWTQVLIMNEIGSGGGGGSTVTITPTLSSGTKIADYSINGVGGELYAPSGGGGSITTYHANWTATASTAVNTKLTQELNLPAGKYLAVTHLAYSTSMNLAQFGIVINDVASLNTIAYVPISYGNASLYFELTEASRVAFGTATGLSMSWDSQYISRGGMDVMKVG